MLQIILPTLHPKVDMEIYYKEKHEGKQMYYKVYLIKQVILMAPKADKLYNYLFHNKSASF